MDSSKDKCNMNKNSAVDCTKAFVDELEVALRRRKGVEGDWSVVRALGLPGLGGWG